MGRLIVFTRGEGCPPFEREGWCYDLERLTGIGDAPETLCVGGESPLLARRTDCDALMPDGQRARVYEAYVPYGVTVEPRDPVHPPDDAQGHPIRVRLTP